MTAYYPKPLPRGYGPAAIDPPDERIPFCTCGHSWEDHAPETINIGRMVDGEPENVEVNTDVCQIKACECFHFDESDGIDQRY